MRLISGDSWATREMEVTELEVEWIDGARKIR